MCPQTNLIHVQIIKCVKYKNKKKADRNVSFKNSHHLPENKLGLNKPSDRQSGLPIPVLYKDHKYGEDQEMGHLLLQIAVDMLNKASK